MELTELTRISANVSALVDSERDEEHAPPAAARAAFAETCRRIGIRTCLTTRRAIENYFSDQAVKAALGEGYAALGHYQRLRDCARPWSKADNWKIARQTSLADLAGTDLAEFLDRL